MSVFINNTNYGYDNNNRFITATTATTVDQ